MESCLLSQLHQMTANLRNMRASMEVCAGPILYECSRANYEHEEGEWYDRWDICGDDDDQAVGVVSTGTGGGVMSTLGGNRYVLKHNLEGHGRCGHRRCRKQQVNQSGKTSSTDSDNESGSQVNVEGQEIDTSEINDYTTGGDVFETSTEVTLKESVPLGFVDNNESTQAKAVDDVSSLNTTKDSTITEKSLNSSDHKCNN